MVDVLVLWADAEAPSEADRLLTDRERRRLQALTHASEQASLRSAHLLGRIAVGRAVGVDPSRVELHQRCSRCAGPHGRPTARVVGRVVPQLSLSRAGRHVVAAVASVQIGVDHEPVGAAGPEIAGVALTACERDQLAKRPADEQSWAILRWWVRKEAVLKMTGLGLLVDPSLVEVSAPHEPPRLVAWAGPGSRPVVALADLDIAGIVAAVAVASNGRVEVRVEQVSLSSPW